MEAQDIFKLLFVFLLTTGVRIIRVWNITFIASTLIFFDSDQYTYIHEPSLCGPMPLSVYKRPPLQKSAFSHMQIGKVWQTDKLVPNSIKKQMHY